MKFPSGLRTLTFGVFNHPVERVVWPAQLEQLTFIFGFNQPIENVIWPASLRVLRLGSHFNCSIEKVRWPAALRTLSLGTAFSSTFRTDCVPENVEVVRVEESQDPEVIRQLSCS